MTKKQFYFPGKKYEWTKETWEAAEAFDENNAFECGPFIRWSGNVQGITEYSAAGYFYKSNLDVYWEHVGSECNWTFSVSEEGVEIPEYLVKFYGKMEEPMSKVVLGVNHLEVGAEYFVCFGVNDERRILFWGHNHHVAFLQDIANGAYHCVYLEEIFHFRLIPVEPTYEEKISEKYNIPLDTVNQMVENGLIKTTDNV